MQQTFEAMQTALRVLGSITEKRHPEPADTDALQAYAGPKPEGMDWDEFACTVIQKAIHRRAEVRSRMTGDNQ